MAAVVFHRVGLEELPRNSRTRRVVPVEKGMESLSFRL